MRETEGRPEVSKGVQFLNDLLFCLLRDNQAQNSNSSLLKVCENTDVNLLIYNKKHSYSWAWCAECFNSSIQEAEADRTLSLRLA